MAVEQALMIKHQNGTWKPADEASNETLKPYKHGDKVAFKISKSRSLEQNNMFHTFLKMVFDNQERFKSKEELMYHLCVAIGHCEYKMRFDKDQNHVVIIERKSTNFSDCSHKKFQEIFEKAKEKVFEWFGISFDEWNNHEKEGQCQNPDCHNQATQVHHIIPGNSSRQICERLGLVVKICKNCHDLSHGACGERYQKGMYEVWCKVLNIDPVETYKKVKGE
jgi:hypothetical protein